jgi:hypothetical protein
MPSFSCEMGKSLHILLKNIHKLPVPPPTYNSHNPYILKKQYREVLVDYLLKIKDINEFSVNINEKVFLPINNYDKIIINSSSSSSREPTKNNNNKVSLGFMNQNEPESSSSREPAKNNNKASLGFIMNQNEPEENSLIIEQTKVR